MNWQEVKHLFDWDGSWRDIYIFDADIVLWQGVLDAIRSQYPVRYIEDSEWKSLPQSASELFSRRYQYATCLILDANGLYINCHFFTPEQIEFDIDPRDIDSEERLNALTEFMRYIGQQSKRDVFLTPEGGEKEILIAYNPQDDSWNHAGVFAG